MTVPVDNNRDPEAPEDDPVLTLALPDTALTVEAAAPDTNSTAPEFPLNALPVLRSKLPDSPELNAFPVRRINRPDDDEIPAPVEMPTKPPDATVEYVIPEETNTFPPAPLVALPIIVEMEPAFPDVTVPDTTTILPPLPDAVAPVWIEILPALP